LVVEGVIGEPCSTELPENSEFTGNFPLSGTPRCPETYKNPTVKRSPGNRLIRGNETEQGITGKLREFVANNHNADPTRGVVNGNPPCIVLWLSPPQDYFRKQLPLPETVPWPITVAGDCVISNSPCTRYQPRHGDRIFYPSARIPISEPTLLNKGFDKYGAWKHRP
jgi:hypothetical protein